MEAFQQSPQKGHINAIYSRPSPYFVRIAHATFLKAYRRLLALQRSRRCVECPQESPVALGLRLWFVYIRVVRGLLGPFGCLKFCWIIAMRPGTSLDLVESFLKTCFFAGLRRLCVGWFLRLDGIRRDPPPNSAGSVCSPWAFGSRATRERKEWSFFPRLGTPRSGGRGSRAQAVCSSLQYWGCRLLARSAHGSRGGSTMDWVRLRRTPVDTRSRTGCCLRSPPQPFGRVRCCATRVAQQHATRERREARASLAARSAGAGSQAPTYWPSGPTL